MANISNLYKEAIDIQSLMLKSGLNNSALQILKSQQKWQKHFSRLNIDSALLSPGNPTNNIFNEYISNLEIIKGTLGNVAFRLPSESYEALVALGKQHNRLFHNYNNLAGYLSRENDTIARLNNLNSAYANLSRQVAILATHKKNWNLITDYEKIASEAADIQQKVIDAKGISQDVIVDIQSFLERIEIKVDKIDKDANAIFWKLLAIISFLISLSGEVQNWLPKQEYASRQEMESIIKHQFISLQKKLIQTRNVRSINRVASARLKPHIKSKLLVKLPAKYEVVLLQSNHRWAYVSFINPNDNLPQTGWILKKYLDSSRSQ